MLVTSREQKLINAFLKAGVLSVAEMMELTGTSRRTLYRDLDKLQKTLPAGISLRNADAGYFLAGDLSQLETARELVEFSATERLYGELMLLIDGQASIASLTEKFGISQPTATSDLRQIEQTLLENDLMLDREKGLKILGHEENIRAILVASFSNSCSIQDALAGQFSSHKLFSLLDLSKFEQSKAAFEQMEQLEGMTDKTRVLMQFFLTATFLRLGRGHSVSTNMMKRPSKQALSFVNQLLTGLSATYELTDDSVSNLRAFTIAEITYLAGVYDVLYFGFGREVLFMEKFDTDFSYKIRQLIERVSSDLEIEFSKDDRLYGMLYAHLKESDVLPPLFHEKQNDFVKKIEQDNTRIFKAVQLALVSIFDRRFADMEFAYVTLHFVATLERSDLVLPLTAALVTSRGRISCEFLMSNLRKNFPFLKKIKLVQSSSKVDSSKYDVIFTTEKALDYLYVNRNLEQKNLDDIRHQLRTIQQKTKISKNETQEKNIVNLNQVFTAGNQIIDRFSITELDNQAELTATVNQVVNCVNSNDPFDLAKLLKERFEETHLAIPDTKIALLHGLHASIDAPLFQIYNLSQEIEVVAMNRKKIKVNRVLLLLSPPSVPDYVAYLLGKISSSIIENKLYTTIYDSGNEAIVSELLRQIIAESIKKYGE
jgi:mannitol operon transcriptional antiterminator